uniref:Uncharacterized protein n=1 Tax=Arundo donax TaxID=35708 RepID=A0A0A9BMM7_ARUDO
MKQSVYVAEQIS